MGDLPKKMGKRKNGRIVMGDLPRWKKKGKSGLIVMGELPKWEKKRKSGLIVMGDLFRWKKKRRKEWSHYNGWPTQVEEWSYYKEWPTQKKDGEGSKTHSKGGRVRKRTTQKVRAQRRTRKRRWGLKGALEKGSEDSNAHPKRR